jgi:DHA3 family macrolide efflux protein-like MFS transporter
MSAEDTSVLQLAESLAYASESAFSHAFERVTGVAPRNDPVFTPAGLRASSFMYPRQRQTGREYATPRAPPVLVFAPLTRRSIRTLWIGQVLAAVGAEFYAVAVVWSAIDFVGSDAGYLSALQAASVLAGSLFLGLVTGRWTHRRTMIVADLARAGLLLLLPVTLAAGFRSFTLFVVIAALVSALWSCFDPALQATVPVLAPEPELRQATNGLFDATKRIARIAGPGMIAIVNGVLPPRHFFTVTTATFVASAAAVRSALGSPGKAAPRASLPRASMLHLLTAGFRAVQGHPVVVYGLVASLIGNAAWAGGYLLGMVLLLRETEADPLTAYGLMMGAYGVGNVTANLLIASLPQSRPALRLALSRVIFGAGLMTLPLCETARVRMVVAALTAVNGPLGDLALLDLLQTRFPKEALTAVFRVQMCAVFGGLLLGYLVAPSLFHSLSTRAAIVAFGAAALAAGFAGAALLRRRADTPAVVADS